MSNKNIVYLNKLSAYFVFSIMTLFGITFYLVAVFNYPRITIIFYANNTEEITEYKLINENQTYSHENITRVIIKKAYLYDYLVYINETNLLLLQQYYENNNIICNLTLYENITHLLIVPNK